MRKIGMVEKQIISEDERKRCKSVDDNILKKFLSQDEDKDILLEKLVFCQFADKYDFENYFRIKELEEGELFRLISFLYHQDCFLMLLDIMNRYKERFVSHNTSFLKELDFSEQFISRLESFMSVGMRT